MIIGREDLNNILSKYASENSAIQLALEKWNSYSLGEFDTRSGPKAADAFQAIANENELGCVVLALIFYELFTEFGEFPRKSLFTVGFFDRMESVAKGLGGVEKEVVDWFLTSFKHET